MSIPDTRMILIDDDKGCNFISRLLCENILPGIEMHIFTDPLQALEYLQVTRQPEHSKNVVLLDINMPEMSGWELLEALAPMAAEIQRSYDIFILSSSVDPTDRIRSADYKLIKGFFEKPLTRLNLAVILL